MAPLKGFPGEKGDLFTQTERKQVNSKPTNLNHPRQTEKPRTAAQKGKFRRGWESGLLIFLGFFSVCGLAFFCVCDASLDIFFLQVGFDAFCEDPSGNWVGRGREIKVYQLGFHPVPENGTVSLGWVWGAVTVCQDVSFCFSEKLHFNSCVMISPVLKAKRKDGCKKKKNLIL